MGFALPSKIRRLLTAGRVWVLALLGLYVFLHFATTEVKPQGTGGLTGPLHVRVYASEYHLVAFYPVYLVERWIRNRSFMSSVYYFNCDFRDHIYCHFWLYDDDHTGWIWYKEMPLKYLAGFLGLWVASALAAWRYMRMSPGFSVFCGALITFTAVIIQFSRTSLQMWEDSVFYSKNRPAIRLTIRGPGDSFFATGTLSGVNPGGGYPRSSGEPFRYSTTQQLLHVGTNHFLVRFRIKMGNDPLSTKVVSFPFEQIMETNLSGLRITGEPLLRWGHKPRPVSNETKEGSSSSN